MECICNIPIHQEILLTRENWKDIYMCRDSQGYYIEVIEESSASIRIKYCPFCGRGLKED